MKRLVIIIVVLVLVGVGVCIGGSLLAPRLIDKAGSTTVGMTPPPAAGVSVVRARGKVVPLRVETLSFATAGTVGRLAVEVGEEVSAGQVVARLDTSELAWAARQAEDALAGARLTYSQTLRVALPEEVTEAEARLSSAEAGLVSARAGLISARVALTQALASREGAGVGREAAEAGLRSARASLESARASLAALESEPDARVIEEARLRWEQARNSLARMQFERDAVQGRPGTPGYIREQMRLDVANHEIAVRLAEISYLQAQEGGATEEALAAARASVAAAEGRVVEAEAQLEGVDEQVTQAEAEVARAEAGVKQAEAGVVQAEASVAQAQASLERLRAGPDDLAVAQAALQVRQAEAEVARARERLEEVELCASFGGTISAVAVEEGGVVTAGAPVVTMADLSGWKIETKDLDEWGVTHIVPEERVRLVFTAFDDKTLAGHVQEIDLNPTELPSGEVAYKVTIGLDEFDAALRWGMSVRVEFQKAE